jgi:hypothetical protein
MECNFMVGQKVVCINDEENLFRVPGMNYLPGLHGLTKGEIYTITSIYEDKYTKSGIRVTLAEIQRVNKSHEKLFDKVGGAGFDHRRFAPLKEKKTDISIFNEILNKVNSGNHNNNYDFGVKELNEQFETVKR